jgi:hypothetical protein
MIPDSYQKALRPLKLRFWSAAALFLIAALSCVSQTRAVRLLERSHAELVRAGDGLARVRQATRECSQVLTALRGYSRGADGASPERLIYGRVDELKANFHPDQMTLEALARKGGEVSLGYSLQFINPDFDQFLTVVSYLETASFPFTPVDSVAISQARKNGKPVLSCTITGRVLASAPGQASPPGQTGAQGNASASGRPSASGNGPGQASASGQVSSQGQTRAAGAP